MFRVGRQSVLKIRVQSADRMWLCIQKISVRHAIENERLLYTLLSMYAEENTCILQYHDQE
jgi:hypothetical protein